MCLAGKFPVEGYPSWEEAPWDSPHIRFFDLPTLRKLLVRNSLTVVDISACDTSLIEDLQWACRHLGRPIFRGLGRRLSWLSERWPGLLARDLLVAAVRS